MKLGQFRVEIESLNRLKFENLPTVGLLLFYSSRVCMVASFPGSLLSGESLRTRLYVWYMAYISARVSISIRKVLRKCILEREGSTFLFDEVEMIMKSQYKAAVMSAMASSELSSCLLTTRKLKAYTVHPRLSEHLRITEVRIIKVRITEDAL